MGLSRRHLYFKVGSAICGAAPSSAALIVGRTIAGVGCAGIFSGTFTIIGFAVPLAKRPIYNGLLGAVYGVSSVAGPLMSGAFTDNLSWRWCVSDPSYRVLWLLNCETNQRSVLHQPSNRRRRFLRRLVPF